MFLGVRIGSLYTSGFYFYLQLSHEKFFYGLGNSLLCLCLSCILCMGWVEGRVKLGWAL